MEYILIVIVVLLTAIAQVLQKIGADRGLTSAKNSTELLFALLQWQILLAIACLVSAVSIWLVVLYMMDVSKAFPFISLGFIVVLLSAKFYLKEHIPWTRWFGVSLIIAGISLLANT